MNEGNIWDRICFWWQSRRQRGCQHDLVADFTAETFLVDKWERCSGVATCTGCAASFGIFIPANRDEAEEARQSR